MARAHGYVNIIINRADGSVSIMAINTFMDSPDGQRIPITVTAPMVEAHIKEWAKTANPEWLPVSSWYPISRENIPDSVKDADHPLHIYKKALTSVGETLTHDIEKAKAIGAIAAKEDPAAFAERAKNCTTLEELHALVTG